MFDEEDWPSLREPPRRIRFSDNNEILEIAHPSSSIAADCPDLTRIPLKSCLKPTSQHLSVAEPLPPNSKYLKNLLHTRPIAAPTTQHVSTRPPPLNKSVFSEKITAQSSHSSQACSSPTKQKEGKEAESMLSSESQDWGAPIKCDFWANSGYKRLQRGLFRNEMDTIFETYKRRSLAREIRNSANMALLTIVELVEIPRRRYARCFTNADLPLQIVVVPYELFPAKAELNSTWTAELETIEINQGYRQRLMFTRVAYGASLSYQGQMFFKGKTRTMIRGVLNSTFYSEFLQYYVPLTHIHDRRDDEQLIAVPFNQIEFNRKVLGSFPNGVAAVEGEGWIEPLPGSSGVLRNTSGRRRANWLLVEPFVATKEVKCHLEDTIVRADPKIWAEQSRRNADKHLEEQRRKAYSQPLVLIHNIPKTPGEQHAKERLGFCHSLVEDLLKVKANNSPVFDRPDDVLMNFQYGFSRKESLRTLAEQCHRYLNDVVIFDYLQTSEPLVLKRLCQILSWSHYYSNIDLDPKLHSHVFPKPEIRIPV